MPNKTNLSIGAVIALLIAAYLGLDLQQSQLLVPSASDTITETLHSEPNLVSSQTTDDLDRIARAFPKVAAAALAANVTDPAQIAELKLEDGATVEEARIALVQKIGENIQVRRAKIVEGENLAVYKHGLKIGVVVSYTGDEATGKGLAMHVAAFNPVAVNAEGVSAELIAKEKEIAEAKALESGKPANIVEKMVVGSVEKYLNEVVLERQMYVIDNDKKVADVLKATGTTVANFVRFEVGEGIEKKAEMSFAEEVAAAQAAAK